MLRVASIETRAEIDALRPAWDDLERRTPEATGFQSFVWCRQWLATAADLRPDQIKPRIVTVHDDDRLVMLLPLQIVRYSTLRVARWIGEPITQYGDALADPGAGRRAWYRAADEAMRRWQDVDLILLKNLRDEGVCVDCGLRPARAGESAPFIDLACPWTRGGQRSLHRRARRLAAHGPVSLQQPTGKDERVASTRWALALKRDWLREKRLFSRGLSHPLSARFLERLAEDGTLDVAVLQTGAHVAAVELGLSNESGYRSLLSAFDRRFADGAPGHALTIRLIDDAKARGIKLFDFLAPADDYKLKWATGEVKVGMAAVPLTLAGRVGLVALRLRPLAKRLLVLASRGSRLVGRALPWPRKPQIAIEAQTARRGTALR